MQKTKTGNNKWIIPEVGVEAALVFRGQSVVSQQQSRIYPVSHILQTHADAREATRQTNAYCPTCIRRMKCRRWKCSYSRYDVQW